jgi:hypothetical protein
MLDLSPNPKGLGIFGFGSGTMVLVPLYLGGVALGQHFFLLSFLLGFWDTWVKKHSCFT